MPESEPKKLSGIFISYRRSDNPDAVGRIYDRLVSEFGKARVFKDVDSIPLGQDFRGHLNDIVGNCAAVLAIIGPRWVDTRNEAGQRRLEDADDFVRIELEAALTRNVPVVPVLVGHAPIPGTSQLPSSLASLAFRQSIEVRPDPDFHNDATRLVLALRGIVDPSAPPEVLPEQVTRAPALNTTTDPPQKHWRQFAWVLALAGVLVPVVIALGIPAMRYWTEPPPPETRVDIVTPPTDEASTFALSPDGRQIVYVARGERAWQLWLRSLSTGNAQPLAGTERATGPFWSPDGRSIGFFATGALRRLDLGGGQPQTLATLAGNVGAGTWGKEGDILTTRGPSDPLVRMVAAGGAVTEATKTDMQSGSHGPPYFLPDGRRFLYPSSSGAAPGIYLGSLDGGAPVRLTGDIAAVQYLPSGWMIWLRGRALSAQRLDLEKGALTGQRLTLADGVGQFSVADNGLIAYRVEVNRRRQITWVDRAGSVLGTVGEQDGSQIAPRVAPDGRRVAVARLSQGNTDIWLLDGVRTTRMTFDSSTDSFPVWSPDGTRIAYSKTHPGGSDIYQRLASGTGTEEPLVSSNLTKFATSWSTDGKYLLYFSVGPTSSTDLWVLPMTGKGKSYVFLQTPSSEVWGQFSPDGRWVAYQSNESGSDEIYVRPFTPPESTEREGELNATIGKWQISTGGGAFPMWSSDGKELYYINPTGEMMAVSISVNGSVIVPGATTTLFQTHVRGGGLDRTQGRQYDIGPDGRFLINAELDSGENPPITLIQNWNPDAGK